MKKKCWERNICSIVYWLFVCVQCTRKRVTNIENRVTRAQYALNDFCLLGMEKAPFQFILQLSPLYLCSFFFANSNSSTFAMDIHSVCHCQKCIAKLKLSTINIHDFWPPCASHLLFLIRLLSLEWGKRTILHIYMHIVDLMVLFPPFLLCVKILIVSRCFVCLFHFSPLRLVIK